LNSDAASAVPTFFFSSADIRVEERRVPIFFSGRASFDPPMPGKSLLYQLFLDCVFFFVRIVPAISDLSFLREPQSSRFRPEEEILSLGGQCLLFIPIVPHGSRLTIGRSSPF